MKEILNCITIGDEKGIGLDLIFKIWKNYRKSTKIFFILGNYNTIKKRLKKINYSIKIIKIDKPNDAKFYFDNYLPILDVKSKSNIHNTLDSLIIGYNYAKKKLITGLITLPLNKDKIIKINKKFIDQTEFFGKLNKKETNMIFYSKKIIISPLTTHIPVKNILKYMNKKYISKKIHTFIKSLKKDFKMKKFKIAICGLNPHAGENGNIGSEEKKIIIPIIKNFKKKGFSIDGPISADTIFLSDNIRKYDCILTIYHDQALIPFKLMHFNDGVNFTSGLDFIRTSPCHGTAYNIVGKKTASEKSLYNSIILANLIYKNRSNDKKIFRSKFLS